MSPVPDSHQGQGGRCLPAAGSAPPAPGVPALPLMPCGRRDTPRSCRSQGGSRRLVQRPTNQQWGARREGTLMLPCHQGVLGIHVICSRAPRRGKSETRTVLCTLCKGKVKCTSSLLSLQEVCTLCVRARVHICPCVHVCMCAGARVCGTPSEHTHRNTDR